MKNNKKKTFAYRPSDQIVSRESIISIILGAAGIVGYCLLLLDSVKSAGTSGVAAGAIGWGILAISAIGLYLAVRSLEDTASVMKWKVLGCISNGLVLAFSVIIFVLGIVM